MPEHAGVEDQPGNGEPSQEKRDKSSIQFAYLPLDDAVAVAKGVHSAGGGSCQIEHLAAYLNLKAATGNFRLKIGNAKTFGLVTTSSGTVTLTPLGSRICDPQQEQVARAESFLFVPLYRQIYEQFKGAILPPSQGLEAAMVTLGVAQKQKAVARQVFTRSATQAGFFAFGTNRLVQPTIRGSATPAITPPVEGTPPALDRQPEKSSRHGGGGGSGDGGDYHPFIEGLLKTLPAADSDWPMDSRRKWLQAASHIFDLIYKDSESKGSLRIEVQKESGK